MKQYCVTLTEDERAALGRRVRSGRGSARELTRARILLKADCGPGGPGWTDSAIPAALDASASTVERVRKRFAEGGLDAALERKPPPARPQKRVLDGAAEAKLITLACSRPPDGHGRWTLDLLADRLVRLSVVPAVSRDTVRRCLKKT